MDMSGWATEGYILNELKERSRTVQYFTDNTTNEERLEITTALKNLIYEQEVVRTGNTFKLKDRRYT